MSLIVAGVPGTWATSAGAAGGAPVTVAGAVVVDVNRNDVLDALDSPLAGVTATVFAADGVTQVVVDVDGVAVVPQVTDEYGRYVWRNLPEGSYVVEFSTIPDGFSQVPARETVGVVATNPLLDTEPTARPVATVPIVDFSLEVIAMPATAPSAPVLIAATTSVAAVSTTPTPSTTVVQSAAGPVSSVPSSVARPSTLLPATGRRTASTLLGSLLLMGVGLALTTATRRSRRA